MGDFPFFFLKEINNKCFRKLPRYLKMKNNSSVLFSHNITNSENKELECFEFVVEGILIPVFSCLGLVGNILSITVLHSPGVDMKVNNMVITSLRTKLSTFHIIFLHKTQYSKGRVHLENLRF